MLNRNNMAITQHVLLIDGSSYLYRAFHALPPLVNSKGEPTGAIYGVASMLRKLLADYQPESLAVIFDTKGKTFRDELYADYKSHRPPMPDELSRQIEPLHQLIRAMGLPLLSIEGIEADDIIGTLTQQALQQGKQVLISSGDKDFAQLVNAKVTLVNTMTNTVLDTAGVQTKFGIAPEQIIDYLTLIGDTVDNIPGVPKVGPKTAVAWLNQYGSLDNIIAHADEIKGKVGENLRASLAFLPLSKQLVTIKTDFPLPIAINDLHRLPEQGDQLFTLLKHLEFKSWLAELNQNTNTASNSAKQNDYQIILTAAEFETWYQRLSAAALFAVDTETTSLNSLHAQIVGISFAIDAEQAIYIPLAHDYLGAPNQLPREQILHQLKPILENPKQYKIGHNLKYDFSVFANHGITLNGIAFDTMLESYVLNSAGSRHDLDTLAKKHLDYTTTTFTDIAGKGAKQLTFNQIPLEKAGPYAAEDADITLQLHECFWPKLQEHRGLVATLTQIEMPLLTVLARMERCGVCIDVERLQQQSREIAKRLEQIEQQAYSLAGHVFNLSSPKQLQEVLYTQLKLPILQRTPTGQASTAEEVLQELALTYPLPKVLLEYRSLSKLKSTYTDRLPEQVDAKTQRIHTSYHQAVAATGRLSSSDPNLQNIPIRSEEGRRIRQAFVVPPGYKLLAADYSQIELRIMAHLSQDPGLLHAFSEGLDIHKATAAEVLNIPIEQVNAEQRRNAKAINFGLIYGMSAFGLARQLGIERHAAQNYMDVYFTRYPGVKQYMENTRRQAHAQGYVETLFGRRLHLPDINARNISLQRAAERAAINAPLQGTAADLIKRAMIDVDDWLQTSQLDIKMIMQVHDELIFEVAESLVDIAAQHIQQLMCDAGKFAVPLLVDIGIGNNWDEAH